MASIADQILKSAGFSPLARDDEGPEPLGQEIPCSPRSPDCSGGALQEHPRTQELSPKCPAHRPDEGQGKEV